MVNRLEITKQYTGGYWKVTSKISEDSEEDFPRDVFLWTLGNDGSLLEFQSIGHIDQIAKYKLYDSNRVSNFGINLVKYSESSQRLESEEEADKCIVVLKSAFDILLRGFDTKSEPVVELYP